MQKNARQKMLQGISLSLSMGLVMVPTLAEATTFTTMTNSIFNSNSSEACNQCHNSGLSGVNRHGAPVGADFDIYTEAASRASTMDLYVSLASPSGYMPMDPAQADFTDAANLSGGEMAIVADWLADGAPFATATAVTDPATSLTKTTANLRGDFNTNVFSATTVPGSYHFSWGLTTSYGTNTSSTARSSTSTTFNQSHAISGLSCGTTYNFRARATNGNGTGSGNNRSLNTSACTDPVIAEGASVSPTAILEDGTTTFTLNYTDDDPGTLTWSVSVDGSKGAFSFVGSATANPVTIRYTAAADSNGADSTGRILVTNGTTTLTDIITVNMSITSVNDQPAITSTASASALEDTLYSYQVVVNDPDDTFVSGLTIGLTNAPGDMAVDGNGLITWTPVNGDATSGLVTVTVSDGKEDGTVDAVQNFTVSVTAENDPPVITPGATTTATEDIPYTYQMQVVDVDDTNNGTDITFTLTNAPTGTGSAQMTVSATGLISWTPAEGTLTSGAVTMTVEDGNEDSSTPTVGNNGVEILTITVTPVNDSPVITSNVAVTSYIEEDTFSHMVTVTDSDINDVALNNGLTVSLTQNPVGMSVDTAGNISWTIPRTGIFNDTFDITVQIVDGLEDGVVAVTQDFTLTVSPPDNDAGGGDLVPDYSDNCPAVKNGASEDNQADFDNDTVYVLGDVDPSDPLTGGDACDTDDDNDGISDTDELLYPGCLDPFNSADATEDCDGDGLDNITEVNDGDPNTTPDADSVGPTVNAPSDVTVNATGLLTNVELGIATGNDGNDGESTIFKAAVDLSAADKIALAAAVTGCQLFSDYETDIGAFRPGTYTVTWATCDSNGNSGQDDQIVNVKPLVSMASGQSVGEGQSVIVAVVLNGDAIVYPATVNYTLTGTATATEDHDGVSGVVTFNSNISAISFNTLTDGITEGDETIDIVLHSPVNIALGSAKRHTVTITEANLSPNVALNVSQNVAAVDTVLGNNVYKVDGAVTVDAAAIDGNGDALSYNWSATSSVIRNAVGTSITSGQLVFDPTVLTDDELYNVAVTVSDGSLSVSANRLLLVEAAKAALTPGDDTDGDGVDDDDASEGYGDDDADGIPNYLDNSSTPGNAIESHTVDGAGNSILETSVLVETDPGLIIALGETAVAAGVGGVRIGLQDIKDHGGATGSTVTNASTDYTFLSSLLNFVVSGLTDDVVSVNVVVPLSSAIQADTVVRKYNSTGWFDFVEDDLNELRSASGADGTCPQPGSSSYSPDLTPGHLCLQMTIQDGGANDADGARNFVVKDPAGLALEPVEETEEKEKKAKGRVGSLSLWFILMMSVMALVIWRQRVKSLRQIEKI